MTWTIGLMVLAIVVYISKKFADIQQMPIDEVFRRTRLESSIRKGDTALWASNGDCVSDDDLILLQKPLQSFVGMGGIGPSYFPSFSIRCIVQAELERRRVSKTQNTGLTSDSEPSYISGKLISGASDNLLRPTE